MLEYGAASLEAHRAEINAINVFPVPDGDTGTNMVVTVQNGLAAIPDGETRLKEIARAFSRAVVFGARGNSGVIFSQFLCGMSERFFDADKADAAMFSDGLARGVERAYGAISEPVEGTMLTVLRDASEAVASSLSEVSGVSKAAGIFIESARRSVERTPSLLPVLRDAGVVDSGGTGIVFFFEGVKRCLDGEPVGDVPIGGFAAIAAQSAPDVSAFGKDSVFEYGYCVEALIQTLNAKEHVSPGRFRSDLCRIGDSVAVSFEDDKVKIHVHTALPERVIEFCHRFGEFLTLKIENMTVQNASLVKLSPASAYKRKKGAAAIAAFAPDDGTKRLFCDMGADAVVVCGDGQTDGLSHALGELGAKSVIVFPCSPDSLEAAESAAAKASVDVYVVASSNIAECYAALAMVDFDQSDAKRLKAAADRVVKGIVTAKIEKDGGRFAAYAGKKIAEGGDLAEAALNAASVLAPKCKSDVITLFGGHGLDVAALDSLRGAVAGRFGGFDVGSVPTGDDAFELIMSFE